VQLFPTHEYPLGQSYDVLQSQGTHNPFDEVVPGGHSSQLPYASQLGLSVLGEE
jgi:hypothetical protein